MWALAMKYYAPIVLNLEKVYRVAQKSKLLIIAVNEINASQTRVSFAKFIPKLVEKMFDLCSIVPNYSLSILKFFLLRSYLLY